MLMLKPTVLPAKASPHDVSGALYRLMILAIALKLGVLVILVILYGVVILAIAHELGRSGDLGCCS